MILRGQKRPQDLLLSCSKIKRLGFFVDGYTWYGLIISHNSVLQ